MRTLAWAMVMFLSPLTMKGLVVTLPIAIAIAYVRWTWIIALVIVSSMVGMASASEYHDERQRMDYDTCNEHQGDVMEHFYNQGWKIVKQDDSEWVKRRGDEEVSFRCEKGLSIIETRKVPVKPQGSVEFQR